MKASTEKILLGAFALDDSIPAEVAKCVIATLHAGGTGNAPADDRGIDGETAAAMLGISRRSVQNYADNGLIRRIGGAATKTRTKYSMRSIREFLNGTRTEATAA